MSTQEPQKPSEESEKPLPQVVSDYNAVLREHENCAIAVAAIQALTSVISTSKARTLMGLQVELKTAADVLRESNPSSISLAAGCDIFVLFVTREVVERRTEQFQTIKEQLIAKGRQLRALSLTSRARISKHFLRFIKDNAHIMVHGYSRVVVEILKQAAKKGIRFSVTVTEARPECSGYRVASALKPYNIPVTLILDSAVGYSMERVDFVLMGAEVIVENGGILNKIGSFQIAVVAKALGKPLYVAGESYKFARLYPLSQSNLPEKKDQQKNFIPSIGEGIHQFPGKLLKKTESDVFGNSVSECKDKVLPEDDHTGKSGSDLFTVDNPSVDFTAPKYITLLFTDLGILTPSAVSDELIKLYH